MKSKDSESRKDDSRYQPGLEGVEATKVEGSDATSVKLSASIATACPSNLSGQLLHEREKSLARRHGRANRTKRSQRRKQAAPEARRAQKAAESRAMRRNADRVTRLAAELAVAERHLVSVLGIECEGIDDPPHKVTYYGRNDVLVVA
jgi:hypothetical protein